MIDLIQKENLYCKKTDGGWKVSTTSDASTLPHSNVAIKVSEDGNEFLWIHDLTEYNPSNSIAKIVFKKLELTDSPYEIWGKVNEVTNYFRGHDFDVNFKDSNMLSTESGILELMVKLFAP